MSVFCSIFSQLLQLFPRVEFQSIVKKHNAERHAKGFSCWGQFISMLFCQLGRAHSLREIVNGLRSCEGKLRHLGITTPKRSTLSYANEHRPWELYQDLFYSLFERCKTEVSGRRRKFRFKNKLLSLDSSTIDLCLSLFDWARFRRTKGAIKLHLVLDHDGYLPCFAWITEGKVSDVKVAQMLQFDPGSIVVDDRGYNDYSLWGKWTAQGVYFVTRMKDNALYEIIDTRRVPQNRNILKDEIIRLTGVKAGEKCPYPLRRVEAYDPGSNRTFVFLSNHLQLGASTISSTYKDRWAIEIFFKALKQNLKIKTFVGTSPNAVKIQIWTALITMLILKYLQLKSQYEWSLSNLISLLRMNLFTHRNLWVWLDKPFETIPFPYENEQIALSFK